MEYLKVCIYGLGFVGNSMYQSFKNKGLKENINLFGYDKFKNGGIGNIKDGLLCDIIFLALPTIYNEELCCYDIEPINECCKYLESNNYSGLIVIKSTVEPESTERISFKFKKLSFIHNPEFLTARTAYEDFHNQTHIVIGKSDNCDNEKAEILKSFYLTYYPNAEISICTSLESESMKIFCNSFYAVKVQFFTELYLLTKSNGSNYKKIISMMLKNNWINQMHTQIPGPDGCISYGGLCFPKDTNALNKYMEKQDTPKEILEYCINERNKMRSDNDNIVLKKITYNTSKKILKSCDSIKNEISDIQNSISDIQNSISDVSIQNSMQNI